MLEASSGVHMYASGHIHMPLHMHACVRACSYAHPEVITTVPDNTLGMLAQLLPLAVRDDDCCGCLSQLCTS